MSVRTIEYTVSAGGILPSSTQRCGVQGEHNATMLRFNIDIALKNTLLNLTAGGGTLYYRFDAYDGAGAVIHYAATTLDLSGAVSPQFPLGNDITYSGGRVTVYLVITLLNSANGEKETEMELYSFPASVELAQKPDGTVSDEETRQSLTTLAESARQSAANAKAHEETAAAVANKLVLKGTASGKGSLTLPDVSPIPHTAKITVKDYDSYIQVGENKCPVKDGNFSDIYDSAVNGNVEPYKTYTLSFENSTGQLVGYDNFAIYTFGDDEGNSHTYFNGILPQTEDGRLYCTFTTDNACLLGMSYNPPDNPYEIMLENVCFVEGTGTEYIPYEEKEVIPDFIPVTISVISDGGTDTVCFGESGTKELKLNTTSGAVSITADNAEANIEIAYNRDIEKAINALENAVELFNTTLAAVVDVEEQ